MKLNDQRVLVIGGSSGIGEATARAFAEAGATVTIASRDAARLAASKDRIGYGVSTGVMDITDDASVRAFLDSAGEFDHVVVSAAQTATGPVRGLELDDAYAAMDSKFWGAYRIARAVRIRQGGSLTFVSGFLSVRPSKNSVLQGAINAALESLARGLALELAPVRVNTVSPGLIATPLWSKIDAEARDRMYEGAAARLPAGRVGQPEDVANAVLYLASTPYATGSTVLVDGGGAIA
ncbi:SDR family oxidoreductase [Burkholderia cepacia]|uniref:SDR family oxidoreductase n=1 Tax=Burkholderia cepacia TaxID=292 RepID=UPI00075C17BD|nr:SDR family oxidoreductase [Burkholderia cepacia]KVS35457.1 short-chain dehydrogenase [Burkholderia cepacia]MCA8122670.1 SDR family oxidoreductase [Burkholderia cepacia]MDN7859670.1 SDR family oxidoreductase [Burkholderia cepacia]NTX46186.1 SDR family oxidoreductase [Burkholderia cepacia]RQT83835.1 SDR family oxidoreductase [Burkholderia cepacia]